MAGIGRADRVTLGDWNAVCFECGRKRKASTMKKNWQGYWVCPEHWEPRHPQDFVRALPDNQTPPWVQPPADCFIGFCTPCSSSGVADFGAADCATADFINPACDEIPNRTTCTVWDDWDTTWDDDGTLWDCDTVTSCTNWDDWDTSWDDENTNWDCSTLPPPLPPDNITPESYAPGATAITHIADSSYSADYTGVPTVAINSVYALVYYQLVVLPGSGLPPVLYLPEPLDSTHFNFGMIPGYTWTVIAAALLHDLASDTYFHYHFTKTPVITITL